MRTTSCALLLLVCASAACESAGDRRIHEARTRFAAFQEALFARDRAALRDLLCTDAHPAIGALCEEDRSERQPLEVTDVERRSYEFLVHVRDPNTDGAASHFVMTVENGAMRVDLRATVRANSVETRRFLAEERFVPQKLTPEQIRQAQVIQAQSDAPAAPAAGR